MGVYKSIVIKNARIWDGEGFLCGDLAVEGKIIKSIGESVSADAESVIDGGGKLVVPGLVDLHVHLKNISCDMYGGDTSLCTVPFGVTCAVDGGASKGDSEYLDTLSVKTAVFVEVKVRNNSPCLDDVEDMAKKFGKHFAGIKLYFDTSNPNVKDISMLRAACDFAKEKGYRVMVHTTGTPAPMTEIVDTLKAGDILTHAYHGAPNTSEPEAFKAIFDAKKKGIIVDAGMACGVHTDFEVLRRAISAGALPDTISTDITRLSAYIRGGRYGLTWCMSTFRHLGMVEEDILRAVTVNPASAVSMDDWSKLKVGGEATFALIDPNSADRICATDKAGNKVDFCGAYKCLLTVVNGDILYMA